MLAYGSSYPEHDGRSVDELLVGDDQPSPWP